MVGPRRTAEDRHASEPTRIHIGLPSFRGTAPVILVAGVSASGKTFSLAGLRERMPELTILSGSGLLAGLGRPLRPLTPEQALGNQRALLDELKRRRIDSTPGSILDGHAMIETTEGAMAVPDWWYDGLSMEGLVHIEADARDIAARRHARSLSWTEFEAKREQEAERTAVRRQAARLDVPLLEIAGGDLDGLAAWLAGLNDRDRGSGTR